MDDSLKYKQECDLVLLPRVKDSSTEFLLTLSKGMSNEDIDFIMRSRLREVREELGLE